MRYDLGRVYAGLLLLAFVVDCTSSTSETDAITGEALVDEVIGNIKSSLSLREDHSLLKRIALVESRFGEDNDVIDANPEGGIWQITEGIHDYLNSSTSPMASAILDEIKEKFDISCLLCTFNYSTSLHSGLVAQLFIEVNSSSISRRMFGQSKWWSENYHPSLDSSVFVEGVTTYKRDPVDAKVDLWFLLDASESVGESEFQKSLEFTCSIAAGFSVSGSKTRCGASIYSKKSKILFPFNKTTNLREFQSRILNTSKPEVTKMTGEALAEVMQKGFSSNVKPRVDDAPSSSRCLIMLRTEGKTDNMTTPIKQLCDKNATVLTIGVGDQIDKEKLKFVNPGNNMYFSTFDVLLLQNNQDKIMKEGIAKAFCGHDHNYTDEEFILICIDLCINFVNEAEGIDRKKYYQNATEREFDIDCSWCGGFNDTEGTEAEDYSIAGLDLTRDINDFISQTQADFTSGVPLPALRNDSCNRTRKGDVWFMLDGSLNVTDEQFQASLDFVSAMASKLNVSNSTVRAGLSVASSDNHVIYNTFNDSSDLDTFQQLVTSAEKPPVTKNVGEALQDTLDGVFAEGSEARSAENGTQRGIVLFVDGDSSDDVSEALEQINQETNFSLIVVEIAKKESDNSTSEIEKLVVDSGMGEIYSLEEFATFSSTVYKQIADDVQNLDEKQQIEESTTAATIQAASTNAEKVAVVETTSPADNPAESNIDNTSLEEQGSLDEQTANNEVGNTGQGILTSMPTTVNQQNTANSRRTDANSSNITFNSSDVKDGITIVEVEEFNNKPNDQLKEAPLDDEGVGNDVANSPEKQTASSSTAWLVPVLLAITMLAFILFFLLYKRKRKRKRQIKPDEEEEASEKDLAEKEENGDEEEKSVLYNVDKVDETNEWKEDNNCDMEYESSSESELENLKDLYEGEEDAKAKILEDLHVITDEAWLPTAGKPQLSRLEKQIDVAKTNEIEDDQLQESCDVKDDLQGRLKALKELKELTHQARRPEADADCIERLQAKLKDVESRRIPREDLKESYEVLKDLKKRVNVINDLKKATEEAKKPHITVGCMEKLERQIELAKSWGVSPGILEEPCIILTSLKERDKLMKDLKMLASKSKDPDVTEDCVNELESKLMISEELKIRPEELKEFADALNSLKERLKLAAELDCMVEETENTCTETDDMTRLKKLIRQAENIQVSPDRLKKANERLNDVKNRAKAMEELKAATLPIREQTATMIDLQFLEKRLEIAQSLKISSERLEEFVQTKNLLKTQLELTNELKELTQEAKCPSDMAVCAEELQKKLSKAENLNLSSEHTRKASDALDHLMKRIKVIDDLKLTTNEASLESSSEECLHQLDAQLKMAEKLNIPPVLLCESLKALNLLKERFKTGHSKEDDLRAAIAEAQDTNAGNFTLIKFEKQVSEAEGQNLPEDLMKESRDALTSLKERVKIVDELERLTIEATKTITPDCLKKLESQIQLAESHNISNDVLTVSYEAMEKQKKQLTVIEELDELNKLAENPENSSDKIHNLQEKLLLAGSLQIPADMLKESYDAVVVLKEKIEQVKEALRSSIEEAKGPTSNAASIESLREKIKAASDAGLTGENMEEAYEALKELEKRDDEVKSAKTELQAALSSGETDKIKEALQRVNDLNDPLSWKEDNEFEQLVEKAKASGKDKKDEDKELKDLEDELNSLLERDDVEAEELESLIARLDKLYADTGDQRYLILKEKAKRKLIDITRYKCILGLQRAIGMRDEKMLNEALDFVDDALETKLKGYDIEADEELSGLCDKAEDLLSLFTQLLKMKNIVMALKQPTISEVRSYNHPPPALRYVMEATYLLLGVEKKKLEVWKEIQSLIAKTGKEALKRRIWERNLEDISFKDALLAQSFIAGYKKEDIEVISKAASVFYSWSTCVTQEVISRHHFHQQQHGHLHHPRKRLSIFLG